MEIDFNYDDECDILYFYPSEEQVDFSIDYDDIILDVSKNKIVGVEIIDAAEKFSKDEQEIEKLKQALKSIENVHMKVDYDVNSIRIKVGFNSSVPENTREGMLIQVPVKREMMVKV